MAITGWSFPQYLDCPVMVANELIEAHNEKEKQRIIADRTLLQYQTRDLLLQAMKPSEWALPWEQEHRLENNDNYKRYIERLKYHGLA